MTVAGGGGAGLGLARLNDGKMVGMMNQRHIQKDAAEEADMQRGVEEAEANMQRIKVMNALHTQGGAE